jgi:hypothetical protein
MAEVYGPEAEGRPGRGDDDPAAAGVVELLHGVCQNATNRMLAMTEENLDVSNAGGNELVVLAFGKYGFGVDSFIKRLSETATRLNARNPGTVSEEELLRTLSNVKAGTTAGAEFEALMDDLPEIRAAFMAKTTILQRDEFAKKYAAFQLRREEKFSSLDKRDMPNHDARAQVAAFLQVELSDLLGHVRKCVGADVYAQIVSALPCEAWNVLTKIV